MISFLLMLSIVSYTMAVVFTGQRFAASPRWGQRRIQVSSAVAVFTHVLSIALVLNETGFRHFNMAATLLIIAALLSIFNLSRGLRAEANLLRPVIFTFAIFSLLLVAVTPLRAGHAITVQPGVTLHIGLSLLAFSILALAALYSLQLLYLNRLLKQRKAKALSDNLPPLMTVENYFFRLLTVGTGVLTLAIVSGFLFVENMFAPGQLHKTSLSLVAWLTFNGILVVHYWRGLRGKPAVIITLIASLLLILAYYGSRFVRDVLLA
ncbi:cytochrome C assembly family protein [Aliidiomarina soli]|uniref:ABC transporter permease n=1 Tax=Aliidiomarina soli TaxID=1928574 RepID=A0A432WH35_9GAMM|nr:cytochrome c biogenesis protein CcsA [Aliidiomarina soli]RUO33084.1 ABC transporter permease [Aliidiomarina soli]